MERGAFWMLGALIGDIVGSVYEWRNRKDKGFPLFQPDCRMTDDSVMTAAVASAVLMGGLEELELFQAHVITEMRRLGRKYPALGYGPRFEAWILSQEPKPYRSLGNGSAMRDKKIFPAAKTRSLPMKSFGRSCRIPQHTNHGTRRFPPSMRSTSFKTAKKAKGYVS